MHAPLPPPVPTADWLVVIARCEATVFRSVAPGTVPQIIRPQPAGTKPGARPARDFLPGPKSTVPLPAFFEPLAGVLHGARRILIFGRVADAGSEADPFIRWLRGHRPEVAQRIVGSMWLDTDQCGEAGWLAQARDFYRRAVVPAREEVVSPPMGVRSGAL